MVRLSEKIRAYMDDLVRSFEGTRDPATFRRYTRVETELEEDIRSHARRGDFTWVADFVPWDPQAAKGPSPLDYFISALGLCHQSHYAEEAAFMGLSLDSVRIRITARYDARPGIGYDMITYETRIESSEPATKVRELVERAERGCFVTNTLKRARNLQIAGSIYLNGQEFMRRTHAEE